MQPSGLIDDEHVGMLCLGAAYASIARPEAADRIEHGLDLALAALMPLDLLWALTPAVLDADPRSTRLFAAILGRLGHIIRPIGPVDPPWPRLLDLLKVIPFDRHEWLGRKICKLHSFDKVWGLEPKVDPYVITSVSPSHACPGQTVVITGSGFGASIQVVRFSGVGGPLDAQVSAWSDIQIQVVVPIGATCGGVEPVIPAGTVTSCDNQIVNIFKPGSGTPYFDGGSPHITRFEGGVPPASLFPGSPPSTRLRVDPGSTMEFSWYACPSNVGVRLRVTARETGQVVIDQVGLAADGRLSVVVPAYVTNTTLDCVLEVSGPCPPSPVKRALVADVAPKPSVKIEGMEVTQGIQRFWRTGITPNSVPLVANKDTIVRVYVSADMGGFNNDEVPGIVGTLSVGPADLHPINGITPTDPSGARPFHTARRRAAIVRADIDHTLNFRIPAGYCSGTKNLYCYLIVPGPGGTVDQLVGMSLNCTWVAQTALKVRWVRIRDERNPATIAPTIPTDAQARETAQRALDHLPYPATDLSAATFSAHTTTRDFTTDAEGGAMRIDIDNLRATAEMLAQYGVVPFDGEERWIGLTVPWFRGWGHPKTCVAPIYPAGSTNRERLRAGHELGHTLGRCHMHDAACFEAAGLAAEPTLDDVAIDPHWNRTIAATGHDFMSYTSPDDNWITTVNWNALRAVL